MTAISASSAAPIGPTRRRRGPPVLPLKPKTWNKAALTIKGDTLTLSLNETDVYERPIEPSNQRTFGLFHYTDDTAVRVRNVVLKGAWPKALPETTKLFGSVR